MCDEQIPAGLEACEGCGFPLVCDVESVPRDSTRSKRRVRKLWKVLGLLSVAALLVTQSLWFLYRGYSDDYFGFTTEIAVSVEMLSVENAGWIEIEGDDLFTRRTTLTLALLEQRSPGHYELVSTRITAVSEIKGDSRMVINEHTVSLGGIGAIVDSFSGRMWIKTRMAFGSDVTKTWDWAVFNDAATLVHEATHVEIKRQGLSLGIVEEEVACEREALEFLLLAGGTQVLIDQKQAYLEYPESPKYRRWYRWYHQLTQGG